VKNIIRGSLWVVALISMISCNQIQVQETDMLIASSLYTASKTARATTQQTINPCTQNCLQYRYNVTDSWAYLYQDQIKGFTFEAGYDYKLRVKIESGTNPDFGPVYTLLKTLEKTKAQ
jgi:Domain of unknown function (DUF4377)